MFGLGALVMFCVGLWMAVSPETVWRFREVWRLNPSGEGESSEGCYVAIRFSGFLLLAVAMVLAGLAAGGKYSGLSGGYNRYRDYSRPLYEETPVPEPNETRPKPVDPFQSAAASPVGSGEQVTVIKPLLEQSDQNPRSRTEQPLALRRLYYPWSPGDHPSAFAQATVLDSRAALTTLDRSQAVVPAGGKEAIGEGTAILVQLAEPVCAVSFVEVKTVEDRIRVSVYGESDVTRCGSTTTGAWVPVRLTQEQVEVARQYQAPAFYPRQKFADYRDQEPYKLTYVPYRPTAFFVGHRVQGNGELSHSLVANDLDHQTLVPWGAL